MARTRSVRSLMEEAASMPPGFARTAVAEEAVRLADAANDLDAGFEARVALASAAEHGGEARKALVAVTWCLGQIDAHPGRFDKHGPYWALKWLPWTLIDIPDVPLDEVERVVAEMRRRYEAEGTGQDAVAKMAWTLPLYLGRIEEAVEAHRHWRLLPRTEYGDCRACDVHSEVQLALAAGDTARALDLARPALAGRLECGEEPARILGRLLAPLVDLGDLAEAERLHQWGLRLARGNPSLLHTQAQHVVHLVRTGRVDDAETLLAELVDVCDHTVIDADSRMWVSAAGACLATALHEAAVPEVRRTLGVRPRATGALAGSFGQEARTTAAAFDRRNGTGAVSEEVETWLAVRAGSVSHAVPAVPSPAAGTAPTAVPATDDPGPGTDDPEALLTRARTQPALTDEARVSLAERALAGFRAAGEEDGVARARRSIGTALVRLGREDDGERFLQDALPDLAAHPEEQAWAALELARLAFVRADGRIDDEVRRLNGVALASAERVPDRAAVLALCRTAEAEWSVVQLGPDATAAQVADAAQAFAGVRELVAGAPTELAHVWGTEASCRAVVGDMEGALAAASTAWDIARQSADDETVAQVGSLTSGLLASTGQLDRALDVLAAVQRAELARGERLDAGDTAVARAELLRDTDREEEALALAWEAVDLYASVGDAVGAAGARLTVARLLRALGQDLNAYDILSELSAQAGEGDDRRFEGRSPSISRCSTPSTATRTRR
ncbi:hypothetical protein [Blastococcus brunescens]|uniref:Tetratricopeptide repeat protein n=1 Tax=Blastococcus brunescens TaxID=1564165 RepID=A0ABZ1B7G9_9ACTN|nr:hypothetical protein [Blastococcus sp. BMG 8361]WRL65763.1 hypothetical protein U6N30_09385 [Blastococcus sp. BMG 8361]